MSEVDDYLAALQKFREYYDFLVKVHDAARKQTVEPRRGWANVLLFRLTVAATSILKLTSPSEETEKEAGIEWFVLDHPSIAVIGRMIVDAAILFGYISDLHIANDEWELRMHILELHDITSRGRISGHLDKMKLGDEDGLENEKRQERKRTLRKLISESPQFKALDQERQKKIVDGSEVYLRGLRAAVREMGQDVNHFDAIWANTSNFVHTHPASHSRSEALFVDQAANTLDLKNQFLQMDVVLDYCAGWLKFVVERTFLLYPELFLKGERKH
ncbi:hypothetical protein [Bradyrhizobium arachidis]|uniref:hypothetical protein n=1 Tax=Bradyrhizobium arachidis TaxID=858423 RepID=UPI0021621A0B|nr:hypothetical protein [Bradyrhizobium arachidis]UVO32262.1 hypothetical protein KUF59_17335 [Bradyrhizobium arachidis]